MVEGFDLAHFADIQPAYQVHTKPSRPAPRPGLVPACPEFCTGHVQYVLLNARPALVEGFNLARFADIQPAYQVPRSITSRHHRGTSLIRNSAPLGDTLDGCKDLYLTAKARILP